MLKKKKKIMATHDMTEDCADRHPQLFLGMLLKIQISYKYSILGSMVHC